MILDKSMSPEAPSGGGYYAHAHPLHPDEEPVSRTYQYRKVMKPMLERKRRARINRCLDELKDLMVTALQSEGENVSKLEKADILELTVRHLHSLKRRGQLVAKPESSYAERFRAGFTHCASEVSQFIANATLAATAMQRQGPVDPQAGARLLQHLSGCIKRLENPQRVLHPIPIAPNGPVQLSPQRPTQPHPQQPARTLEQQGEARGLKRCAGERMEAPPRATKQHCYAPPSPPHSPASGSGAAASTSADALDAAAAARSMWRPW